MINIHSSPLDVINILFGSSCAVVFHLMHWNVPAVSGIPLVAGYEAARSHEYVVSCSRAFTT